MSEKTSAPDRIDSAHTAYQRLVRNRDLLYDRLDRIASTELFERFGGLFNDAQAAAMKIDSAETLTPEIVDDYSAKVEAAQQAFLAVLNEVKGKLNDSPAVQLLNQVESDLEILREQLIQLFASNPETVRALDIFEPLFKQFCKDWASEIEKLEMEPELPMKWQQRVDELVRAWRRVEDTLEPGQRDMLMQSTALANAAVVEPAVAAKFVEDVEEPAATA